MAYSDYLVFVDESGDHSLTSINPQYPLFLLCFCIVRKDVYAKQITPALREIKQQVFGHDLVVLHEYDIRKRLGDFNRLNKEAREVFMGQLHSFVIDADFQVVAVAIDKQRHIDYHDAPPNPYHLALRYGLERINELLTANNATGQTHVVVECRGKKEDAELELEFRRVCDGHNKTKKHLPFDLVMANKLTNSEGLQIADLIARPIGLSVLRPEQANRAVEAIQAKYPEGGGLKVWPPESKKASE